MEFLYFLVIVIIGMVIHRKLRSRIDYLSKELAALRVEIASLMNTNASHTGKQQLSQVADQLTSEITEQTFPGHKVVTQQSVAKAYPPAPSYPKNPHLISIVNSCHRLSIHYSIELHLKIMN